MAQQHCEICLSAMKATYGWNLQPMVPNAEQIVARGTEIDERSSTCSTSCGVQMMAGTQKRSLYRTP